MNDIIRNGVIMAVYLFIVILLFIVLSSPFDNMMSTFEDVNLSDPYVDDGVSQVRLVYNIMFAGLGCIPLVWFIIWVFIREPDWRYRQ